MKTHYINNGLDRAHAQSSLSSYLREFSTDNVADPGCSLPVQKWQLTGSESIDLHLLK